jgi:hypothetical protein
LKDLYFELEQITCTIAALERIARMRERRHNRARALPPGLLRDTLMPRKRSAKAPCLPRV